MTYKFRVKHPIDEHMINVHVDTYTDDMVCVYLNGQAIIRIESNGSLLVFPDGHDRESGELIEKGRFKIDFNKFLNKEHSK